MFFQHPMKTLTFLAPDPIDVVRGEIAAVTLKSRWQLLWPYSHRGKLFYGEVSEDAFRLTRIIYFRNPSLPVAIGRLETDPQGTKICVDLTPNSTGARFDFVWNGFLILFIGLALLFAPWEVKILSLVVCVGLYFLGRSLNRWVISETDFQYEWGFEQVFGVKAKGSIDDETIPGRARETAV